MWRERATTHESDWAVEVQNQRVSGVLYNLRRAWPTSLMSANSNVAKEHSKNTKDAATRILHVDISPSKLEKSRSCAGAFVSKS